MNRFFLIFLFWVVFCLIISSCKATLVSDPLPEYSGFSDPAAVSAFRSSTTVRFDARAYETQSVRPNQLLKDTSLVVTASGGGVRAEAFTLGVLAGLEELKFRTEEQTSSVLDEVDYFSTVSGGGWGTLLYWAARNDAAAGDYSLVENQAQIEETVAELHARESIFDAVGCLASRFSDQVSSVTLGSMFESPKMPYLLANGVVMPNHAPFVFSREFLQHYSVSQIFACGGDYRPEIESWRDVPLAYAIAVSSTVPGFQDAYALSRACRTDAMTGFRDSELCQHGHYEHDLLNLADGGLYDNYGFETAMDVLSTVDTTRKVVIVIDAGINEELSIDTEQRAYKWRTLRDIGSAPRQRRFRRTAQRQATAIGAKLIHLEFFDGAGEPPPDEPRYHSLRQMMIEMDGMVCWHPDSSIPDGPKSAKQPDRNTPWDRQPEDCRNNNAWRVGRGVKTSYRPHVPYHRALFALGRLVVARRAVEIRAALGVQPA